MGLALAGGDGRARLGSDGLEAVRLPQLPLPAADRPGAAGAPAAGRALLQPAAVRPQAGLAEGKRVAGDPAWELERQLMTLHMRKVDERVEPLLIHPHGRAADVAAGQPLRNRLVVEQHADVARAGGRSEN